MSRDVSVFVALPASIEQVSSIVGSLALRHHEVVEDGPRLLFRWSVVDLDIVAYDGHTYEDDLGIPFEAFPLVVSLHLHTHAHRQILEDLRLALARYIAAKANSQTGAAAMVVEDMQRVLLSLPAKGE